MGFGTIVLMDPDSLADHLYALAFMASSLFLFLGAKLYAVTHNLAGDYAKFSQENILCDDAQTLRIVWLVFYFSLLVTAYYYYSVGSNLVIDILLGTSIEDFSTARLSAYSGEQYFAPGYANQFKNVLLPISASIIGVNYYFTNRRYKFYLFCMFAFLVLPVSLLGTGQRAFLAYACAAFVFGIALLIKIKYRYFILPGVIVIFLFAYSTYLYKIDQIVPGESVVISSLQKTLERFLYIEQEGTLVTYRFLYDRGFVFFYEWYEQIRGVLPGVPGSYLQHEMFALRHGTDRGTEAVSTLASAIYNGTWGFVPLFYLGLGYTYQFAYHIAVSGKKSAARMLCFGALFFHLAIFVSGGPGTLVNNGVLAIILLLTLIRLRFTTVRVSPTHLARGHG